jgi:hypothetical protein
MRSFLGVWQEAEVLVGTKSFNNKKQVEPSGLRREGDHLIVKDNAFTGSITLSTGVPASVGPFPVNVAANISGAVQIAKSLSADPDKPVLGKRSNGLAKDRTVIVYNVATRVGWLVPELCVALWLAHAFV